MGSRNLLYLSVIFSIVLLSGMPGYSQDEGTRIDITGFEDLDLEWSMSGGNVVESGALDPTFDGADSHEGDLGLYVRYDSAGQTWRQAQLNLENGPFDLTGMREIHMWVYFVSASEEEPEIRMDVGGGSLGVRSPSAIGEWIELVYPIDRLTSDNKLGEVTNIAFFLDGGSAESTGTFYIDEIYAYRPAGIPEIEEVLVWGFNEEDPATGFPMGWDNANGEIPGIGFGEITPAEGDNYMLLALSPDGWVDNAKSANALSHPSFADWPDVKEIIMDLRVEEAFAGGWLNFNIVLQSSANGWDLYPERGIANQKEEWGTYLWQVDMSKHADAFDGDEDDWFQVVLVTNQPVAEGGKFVFIDNFRVGVPADTPIEEWSVY